VKCTEVMLVIYSQAGVNGCCSEQQQQIQRLLQQVPGA
jgi:hypothetical protein